MATMKLDVPKALAAQLTQFFGECSPASIIAATDYAVRRKLALHKDTKRHAAGKLASRLYAPRVDMVEKVPRALVAAVESIDAVAEKLAEKPTKPAKNTPKKPAKGKA